MGRIRIIFQNETWAGNNPQTKSLKIGWDEIRSGFLFSLCREGPSLPFSRVDGSVPQTQAGRGQAAARPGGPEGQHTAAFKRVKFAELVPALWVCMCPSEKGEREEKERACECITAAD